MHAITKAVDHGPIVVVMVMMVNESPVESPTDADLDVRSFPRQARHRNLQNHMLHVAACSGMLQGGL